ncbi:MAG: hypothetical protein WBO43_13760 [Gemmatimonadota bacterium]
MDPVLLILTMLFWIIIAGVIGGVILLRPVSKKLGTFLEEWTAIRRLEAENRGPEIQRLAARLEALESEQVRLLESVDFHEKLSESKED